MTATLSQRTGGESAAAAFAETVDAVALARGVSVPMLVVAGGDDAIPAADQARAVAGTALHGHLNLVDGGDHLVANRQWKWLGATTDWLADQLAPVRSERRA